MKKKKKYAVAMVFMKRTPNAQDISLVLGDTEARSKEEAFGLVFDSEHDCKPTKGDWVLVSHAEKEL